MGNYIHDGSVRRWPLDGLDAQPAVERQIEGADDTEAQLQVVEDRYFNLSDRQFDNGVAWGLRASNSGLTVSVSSGLIINGAPYKIPSFEYVLGATENAYIYVDASGDYTTAESTDDIAANYTVQASLTTPGTAGDWYLVALVQSSGGSITSIDNDPIGKSYASSKLSRVLEVKNTSGATINRGEVVYPTDISYSSGEPLIEVAATTLLETTYPLFGIALNKETLTTNNLYVITEGALEEPPQGGETWSDGDIIYVDIDGTLTNAEGTGVIAGIYDATSDILWVDIEVEGSINNDLYLGSDNTDDYRILARDTDGSIVAALKYNITTSAWQYSNDGSTYNDIGSGGGGGGTAASSVVAETSYGLSSSVGISTDYARGDHTHGSPSLSNADPEAIAPDNIAAEGTGTLPSRADHVHAVSVAAPTGSETHTAADEGVADTLSRSDHEHLIFDEETPLSISINNTVGTSGGAPYSDHTHQGVHSIAKEGEAQIYGDVILKEGTNVTLTQSGNDITITSSGGAGGTAAGSVSSETTYGISASAGVATTYARGDHTHGSPSLSTNNPANVGSTAAPGSGTAPSKDDHVHVGVYSVKKSGSTDLNGTITLSEGSNITLTQIGNDISISASTGAGSVIKQSIPVILNSDGTAVVSTNVLGAPVLIGHSCTITKVIVRAENAPSGDDIICDVNKNGSSIFALAANQPTILDGANTGSTTTIATTALAEGDRLTFDIDQIGSTTAGGDLTLTVIMSAGLV